jgi:hypothetical protein
MNDLLPLAERRRLLYSLDFWRILSRQMPPFSGAYEDEMLQALARSTQVPVERVKAHYRRYIHACHVIRKLLTHPGNDTKQ